MATTGTATLDFGSAPGTNIVTVDVTGQAGVLAASNIEPFIMGVDSTASHNAYEHAILQKELGLSVTAITAGSLFTIQAQTQLRLTGTVKCRWVGDY
jgi:hypothetical protein